MRVVNITDLTPTDPCLQCMMKRVKMGWWCDTHSAPLEVLVLASLHPPLKRLIKRASTHLKKNSAALCLQTAHCVPSAAQNGGYSNAK